ncbi:hypothetical protein WR25_19853 [Diploscapter pachys]|uniref:ABM domain-containing protein n=1 Tax=Diploscapter pachys TaxID=2018661 RepID=A0A2A2KCA4_9BILA|nr:hypothetical protein WR25_19853 [Diploscapter pachys]
MGQCGIVQGLVETAVGMGEAFTANLLTPLTERFPMTEQYAFILKAKTRPEQAEAFEQLFRPYVEPSRQEPGCIDPQGLATQGVLPGQADRQCKGRDGERQAQRLDQLVAAQAQALQVGHRGHDEHAGGGRHHAREQPAERPQPGLPGRCHAQPWADQAIEGIDQQSGAQAMGRPRTAVDPQPDAAQQGADEDHRQHPAQAAQQREQVAARRQLPEVGQGRWHDQQRRSLRRSHSQAKQSHGDGRQPQADDTLDRAGQEKGQDHQQRQRRADVLIKRQEGIHGHHPAVRQAR